MDSFAPKEMEENSRTSKLIDAALISNSVILQLDNGPQLWKYFPTPLYKKLCRGQKFMEDIAVEMVNRKIGEMERGEVSEKVSLLQLYLNNRNLDVKDVIGMATDMLLAGIDTTTYSIAFALYHLSNSDDAQKKMKQEADTLLSNSCDHITPETLRNAVFTKAVIKESFRLNPISVGVGRVLKSDIVLSGYHIPSGTVAVTQNQVTCRLPEYFSDPNCFIPERWLRDNNSNSDSRNVHPYLVLPFGHGPRSCIARRLAEQNMQILLLRIFQKYHLKWRGGKLDSISLLINKPDSPIDIEFSPR
nr:cytochrome P450 4AV17 [Meteorus pulchricornis]